MERENVSDELQIVFLKGGGPDDKSLVSCGVPSIISDTTAATKATVIEQYAEYLDEIQSIDTWYSCQSFSSNVLERDWENSPRECTHT